MQVFAKRGGATGKGASDDASSADDFFACHPGMSRMKHCFLAAAALAGCVLPAAAASPDAWETFREEVKAACLEAAKPLFETAVADVDPFGSESYGLALVHGKAKGADAGIRAICVFDKKSKKVEIGGELPPAE
jgi:hypothetical protein